VTAPSSISTIQLAADRLRSGGVVAFPTETVYGLGADALNTDAVDLVFTLKGRPRNNPLIVHVSGPEMARRVASAWPKRAEMLARAFWPGPLSILVPRSLALPASVTGGGELVAVRCPNHPVTLALLFEFRGPIIGPSANKSGMISPTTAAHVRESFIDDDVMVLEGGACEAGIESTVVDVMSTRTRVLRPGLIGADELSAAIGEPVDVYAPMGNIRTGDSLRPGDAFPSPGMLERHYAPATPAFMFASNDWERLLATSDPVVVITHRLRRVEAPHRIIAMPPEAADYAAALYAALHEADRSGAPVILIEQPPEDGTVWAAVADRLRRATTRMP